MVKEPTKNKLLLIEGMLVVMLLIFVGAFALDKFFPTPEVSTGTDVPGIVGFVPVEIKSQPIDLVAEEPTSFVLFSDKQEQFALTSLRLSGTVTGEGRAEILLDNGRGQELLIYSNIKQKKGNLITGMSVTSEEEGAPLPEDVPINEVAEGQAWIKITEEAGLDERPAEQLGEDKKAVQGEFQHACLDTCYMNMKMREGLYYMLKVRVDPGTKVKINELKYTLEV